VLGAVSGAAVGEISGLPGYHAGMVSGSARVISWNLWPGSAFGHNVCRTGPEPARYVEETHIGGSSSSYTTPAVDPGLHSPLRRLVPGAATFGR
jgi:hypothetical protein